MIKQLIRVPAEAYIWIVALLTLFVLEPSSAHYTICPFHHLGFTFCPGCGLGRSISYAFAGDLYRSFESHPLGLFALIVLVLRIIKLIKNNYQSYGTNY
jgi:hypothetical protein